MSKEFLERPKKPIRKEYWAGHNIENDEQRYVYGLKQYAEKAEKYIEFLESQLMAKLIKFATEMCGEDISDEEITEWLKQQILKP